MYRGTAYNPAVLDERTLYEWNVVYQVFLALSKASLGACLNGGAVRDVIAGVKPADYDFIVVVLNDDVRSATRAVIHQIMTDLHQRLKGYHVLGFPRDVASYGTLSENAGVVGAIQLNVRPDNVDDDDYSRLVMIDITVTSSMNPMRVDYDVNALRAVLLKPIAGEPVQSCIRVVNNTDQINAAKAAIADRIVTRPPCGDKCLLNNAVQQLRRRKMIRHGYKEDTSEYNCENPECVRAAPQAPARA